MADRPLTARQQQVLNVVRRYTAEHGYAPTVREIAEHCGVSSLGSVTYQLKALRARGLITDGGTGIPRSLRVLDTPAGNGKARAAESEQQAALIDRLTAEAAGAAAGAAAYARADERIAQLESEVERLRAALAHVADAADEADDTGPGRADAVREWREAVQAAGRIAEEGA